MPKKAEGGEGGKWKSESGKWGGACHAERPDLGRIIPPPRQFCEECENTGVRVYGTWKNIRKTGGRKGTIPTPGILYRYQNRRVTEFDGWKLLKTKSGQFVWWSGVREDGKR
jgi:hypothetical protein